MDELAVARTSGTIPQNVNYAVKSPEVLALLRSKGIKLKPTSGKAVKDAVANLEVATASAGLVVVR